jgi:cell wall assembly regulator SMI1/predicted DNA-binding WGR domain protein
MKRYYLEHKATRSFWEGISTGATLTVRSGSIGTEGRTIKKKFKKNYDAFDRNYRLAVKKVREGYKMKWEKIEFKPASEFSAEDWYKPKLNRIEEAVRKNDTAYLKSLKITASKKEIAILERRVEHKLPTGFKKMISLLNGWRPLKVKMVDRFLSCRQILQMRKQLTSLARKYPNSASWSPHWIPFSVSARGRDFYCLDFGPSESGKRGQIILWSVDGQPRIVADSFDEWLNTYILKERKDSAQRQSRR